MRTWDMNLLSGAAVWRLGFLRPFLAMVDRLFAEDERSIHWHKCRSNKRALKECQSAHPYSGGLGARTFDRLRSDALRRYAMDGQIYGVEVPQDLCAGGHRLCSPELAVVSCRTPEYCGTSIVESHCSAGMDSSWL